jgi:hypothetical protein
MPAKTKRVVGHRLPPTHKSIDQDEVEQYFDELIRRREDLHNPEGHTAIHFKDRPPRSKHRANRSLIESDYDKLRLKQSSTHAIPKQIKQQGRHSDKSEGEERLIRQVRYFRRQMEKVLNRVEEYVVAIK